MPYGAGMNGNSAIQAFARFGYAAKGVVYMLIGALALGAALGSGAAGDSSKAIIAVNDKPFGKVMLAVIGVGLVAYVFWRWYSGIANPEDKKPATRLGYIGTGVINFGVALEALRMAFSNGGANAGNQAPHWTAQAMSKPAGVWLVAAVGAGIAAYGFAQIIRALRSKLDKQLRLGELEASTRVLVRRVSRIGIAARGAVFVVMGFFLAKAALEQDPSEARDLGAALRTVHEQPYGKWLLGGVAVGLFLYGLYNLVRSRY
ncbi:MAG TPA: DUF1206 domain-containing protein, partial [Roseiflexaceae bacterium]|nr:DUF1206 domain-containing protein [Roseiflexaceae bacterium]